MTKYEGQQYRPSEEVPSFFSGFLQHYQHVVRFLTNFNENRLRFDADIRNQVQTVTLNHGVPTTFRHSLGYIPAALDFQGRVEMWKVSTFSADTVTVAAKLLSSPLVAPIKGQLVLQVAVVDPTLFYRGDRVLLGNNIRTIAEIQDNLITLDQSVYCGSVYVLSLATETTKVMLY